MTRWLVSSVLLASGVACSGGASPGSQPGVDATADGEPDEAAVVTTVDASGAGADAGPDARADAGHDTRADAGLDAQADAGPDAQADGAAGPACDAGSACRTFSSYCGGCTCEVLGAGNPGPSCDAGLVSCFVDPCQGHVATCGPSGRCALQ